MRILIVDDEPQLREQLESCLSKQHYTVVTACNGATALEAVFDTPFDAVILDLMMPDIDGLKVLSEIRQAGIDTPVLILTAKGAVSDRIKGLDLGADDYLAKPFSLDEMLARLRALLRRAGSAGQSRLAIGDLELDTVSRVVTRHGVTLELTPREFSILEFLLYNKNRAVTRFSLAEHVWGDDFDPFNMSNFMDVHIKNLRQKIGDTGADRIVQTVRGVGYIIRDSRS